MFATGFELLVYSLENIDFKTKHFVRLVENKIVKHFVVDCRKKVLSTEFDLIGVADVWSHCGDICLDTRKQNLILQSVGK